MTRIKIVPGRPRRRAATTGATAAAVARTATGATLLPPATASAARPTADLSAPAETMTACAEELARQRSALGGPGDAALQEGELVLVVDQEAVTIAEGLAPALEGETKAQADTGVTPKGLRTRIGQFRGLARYLVSAEGLLCDVQDTRMALRSRGRRHRGLLIAAIQHRLADLPPGSPEHKRLAGNARALLALAARPAEERKETLRKNRRTDDAVETRLSDISRQKEMVQTIMALQAGEDVPLSERAAAADTYAALETDGVAPAPRQRTGRRSSR